METSTSEYLLERTPVFGTRLSTIDMCSVMCCHIRAIRPRRISADLLFSGLNVASKVGDV